MAEYIERGTAINVALNGVDRWDGGCNANRNRIITEEMNAIPPADVVEVVRCKDCANCSIGGENSVSHFYWCESWQRDTDAINYCSYGERKGGDGDGE